MNTLNQQFEQLKQSLEQYEKQVGLPKLSPEHTAGKYLDIPEEQYKKFDDDKLYEINCVLSSYAAFLQRELNKKTSYLNWAKNILNRVVAKEGNKYNKYSYEERYYSVVIYNEFAGKLNDFISKAQLHVDTISWMPQRVESLSKRIDSLLYSRRKKYAEN